MSEAKTRPTRASVAKFIEGVDNDTRRACLYINKLEDVHLPTLRRLIDCSVRRMRRVYGRSAEGCAR